MICVGDAFAIGALGALNVAWTLPHLKLTYFCKCISNAPQTHLKRSSNTPQNSSPPISVKYKISSSPISVNYKSCYSVYTKHQFGDAQRHLKRMSNAFQTQLQHISNAISNAAPTHPKRIFCINETPLFKARLDTFHLNSRRVRRFEARLSCVRDAFEMRLRCVCDSCARRLKCRLDVALEVAL